MYEPAGEINEVGGDFYEVFPVEDGWAVVLGDVSGKGAAAAALTAEARHTIRTAGCSPAIPVAASTARREPAQPRRRGALLGRAADPAATPTRRPADVTVYLAGHPHPLLIRDQRAEVVGQPGPLLGVVDEPVWLPATVAHRPGDQLVLYTDGVIEAKRANGERFGTDRLRDGLAGCESPELAVERVRMALADFGAQSRQDDAALVAIRRARPPATAAAGRARPPGRSGVATILTTTAGARAPALFMIAGIAVAAVALGLAAAAGPPYLSLSELSPWLVVYADRAVHRPVRDAVRAPPAARRPARGGRPLGAGPAVVGRRRARGSAASGSWPGCPRASARARSRARPG